MSALLIAGAAACASDDSGTDTTADAGSDESAVTEPTREEIFDEIDEDDDGVVTREAFEQAAAEAALREFLDDYGVIAASFPGGELTVGAVRASIVESPPSLTADPSNPSRDEFISRLTSMLQLRLASAALTELGFEVDVSVSDAEINTQVQAHLEGPFEAFAQQRAVAQDPTIERLATPHCVSALALTTQADAVAAAERVRSGEDFVEVAVEVNPDDLTEPGGVIGCGQPIEMFGGGELPLVLMDLAVGELAEPVLLPSGLSPTGELWIVLHLDDLLSDQTDLESVGPFAGRVLSDLMVTYDVMVDPRLGDWSMSSLSVALPQSGS